MAQHRSDLPAQVGKRLRELRKERGLTQEQVGERSGFTGKYVSEIERGLRDPPLSTLERIAVDGVGCPVHQVLAGVPGARRPEAGSSERGRLSRDALALVDALGHVPHDAKRRRLMAVLIAVIELARAPRS